METPLTLAAAAAHPELLETRVGGLLFRPLLPGDAPALTDFYESLSPRTRAFTVRDEPPATLAAEQVDAIARYDKFRMVALDGDAIVALFELSLDCLERERYADYGIALKPGVTCRFGPCLRDHYQARGFASALMPPFLQIARRFGQRTMILWGGVHADNERALRFYERHGFRTVGGFVDDDRACLDMAREL